MKLECSVTRHRDRMCIPQQIQYGGHGSHLGGWTRPKIYRFRVITLTNVDTKCENIPLSNDMSRAITRILLADAVAKRILNHIILQARKLSGT